MIFILLMFVAVIFCVFIFFRNKAFLSYFKRDSVCVFGKKGKGKDVLFNYAIKKEKIKPYSNYSYGGKAEVISLKELDIKNTYEEAFSENWNKVANYKIREGSSIFISDAGVYLPSQYYNQLNKKYPSLPLYMAVSRHLSDTKVHYNTQSIGRVWDKLREQITYFIEANKTTVFFNHLSVTTCTVYDRVETAEKGVTPFKPSRTKGKEEIEAERLRFVADNGLVRRLKVVQWLKKDSFDSRFFKKKLLIDSSAVVSVKGRRSGSSSAETDETVR